MHVVTSSLIFLLFGASSFGHVLRTRQFSDGEINPLQAMALFAKIREAGNGPAAAVAGIDNLEPNNIVKPGVKRSRVKFGPLTIGAATVVCDGFYFLITS